MELERVEKLIDDWHSITSCVIEFQKISLEMLQGLFEETYIVLDEFGQENLVPKQISRLLLEMHDFGWWVGDLEETPLYEY